MKGQTNNSVLKNRLQRTLRRNMTDAEQALWKRLRGYQVKGRKFRRQHPFGDFILDFVCLEVKLVVEIDGGQHNGSAQDRVRDRMLESAGFRIMRFWNNQVLNEIESVVEAIWLALGPHPHPNPPLEGEGANAGSIHQPHPNRTHPHPNLPPEGEGTIAPPLEVKGRGQARGAFIDPIPSRCEGEGANP
ncbi:endonuclease domain-containing protein [Thiobacillus sp.]